MTEEEIGELERLLEKATPQPWQVSGVRVKLGKEDCQAIGPDGFSVAFLPIGHRPHELAGALADARLIAAMRNALPRLLSSLKRGKEEGSSAAAAAPIASTAEAFEAAAKVADDRYKIAREMRDDHGMRICTGISTAIRSLSPKGKNEATDESI